MAKVALLIGISEYEPGLNPLPGSVKDVNAMQHVLAHPEIGDFAEADITVLKNPQRQEMEDAIYRLFSDRKKEDLLLFYFSGHGIKDESGKLYLATRTTRKENTKRDLKDYQKCLGLLDEDIISVEQRVFSFSFCRERCTSIAESTTESRNGWF